MTQFNLIPLSFLIAALVMLVGCGKDIPEEVVYSRFNHATVLITTATGHGTGVIIEEGNYIVTAYHVVKGHSKITIKHPSMDAERYATVLSYDILADIALLKPSPPISIDNYPEISTHEPVVGSVVTVIGYPVDSMPPPTLTKGVISSTDSDENGIKYIKLDATVNRGNSGGPVFSERGDIIGLIVLKRLEEAWAVSSPTLSELLPQLKSYAHPHVDTGGGAIVSGQSRAGSIEMPGDTDVYTFSGEYGSQIDITLSGDGTVFDLTRSQYSRGLYAVTEASHLTALTSLYLSGTGSKYHFVTVSSPSVTHGNPKPYTLTLTYTDPPADTGGGAIVSGQSRAGSIEMPGDTDVYTFSGEYGSQIDITLSGDGTVFDLTRSQYSGGLYSAVTEASHLTALTSLYLSGTGSKYYLVTVSSPSVTHGNPKPYTLTLTYTDPPV